MGIRDWFTTGVLFFVDSNNGAATNDGLTPGTALTTLAAALALCTANKGDIVFLMPAHAETLSAELSLSTEGVSVVGLGNGDNRAVITADNTATSLTLAADNLRLDNIVFKNDVDNQVQVIDVADAEYFVISNCVFLEGSAKQFLEAIEITNVGADHGKIINCEILCPTAGPNSGIKIGVACDDLEIAGCKIDGDFADAGIQNPTGNVATKLNIHHNYVGNDQTGDHAIQLVSACTGTLRHNDLYSDTITAALDPGSCKSIQNYHTAGIDLGSQELPVADQGEGGNTVVRATATLPQTADSSLFTVANGQVELLALIGEVTTVIETQANATKLKFNPTGTGADVVLCADLDITADAVGTLYSLTGDPNDIMQDGLWVMFGGLAQPIVLGPGVIELECDASNTGNVGWQLLYRPLEPGATVVSA